jgi:hypothetical protein
MLCDPLLLTDDTSIFMGLLNDLFPKTLELVPRAVDTTFEARVSFANYMRVQSHTPQLLMYHNMHDAATHVLLGECQHDYMVYLLVSPLHYRPVRLPLSWATSLMRCSCSRSHR